MSTRNQPEIVFALFCEGNQTDRAFLLSDGKFARVERMVNCPDAGYSVLAGMPATQLGLGWYLVGETEMRVEAAFYTKNMQSYGNTENWQGLNQ